MTINEKLSTFADLPAVEFAPGADLPDLSRAALRVSGQDLENFESEQLVTMLEALAGTPGSDGLEALVLGWWGSMETTSGPAVAWLAANASAFPRLRAVFVGDMTSEENEMSWINQSDIRPLLAAYPGLTHLATRGVTDGYSGAGSLVVGPVQHANLRSLVIQSGGLPKAILQQVLASELPSLTHLEIWLGTDMYGADITVTDLAPLLDQPPFPLTSLGICNAKIADEVAAAIASAPVVAQLEELSLFGGELTDAGAESILNGQSLSHLRRLDLHHHFMSPAVAARLQGVAGEVDVSDAMEADEYDGEVYRYVMVGE